MSGTMPGEKFSEDPEESGEVQDRSRRRRRARLVVGAAAVGTAVGVAIVVSSGVGGIMDNLRNLTAPPSVTGESFSNTEIVDLQGISEICSTKITFAHSAETDINVPLPGPDFLPELYSRVSFEGAGEATVCTPVAEIDQTTGEVTAEYITAVRDTQTGNLRVTVDTDGTTMSPRWLEDRTRVVWADGKVRNLADAGANLLGSIPFVDQIIDTGNFERTLRGIEADATAQIRQKSLEDVASSCDGQLDQYVAGSIEDAVYAMAAGFGASPEQTEVVLTTSSGTPPVEAVDTRIDYGADALDPASEDGRYTPREITGGFYTIGAFTSGEQSCEVTAEGVAQPPR